MFQIYKQLPRSDLSSADNGFVALTATIIIGALLLLATVTAEQTGWRVRVMTLQTERKQVSLQYASACAHEALARLLHDGTYQGEEEIVFNTVICKVGVLSVTTSEPSNVSVTVSVDTSGIVTHLRVQAVANNLWVRSQLQASPLPHRAISLVTSMSQPVLFEVDDPLKI